MKIKNVIIATIITFPTISSAALVYNNESNKLDLYGKLTARHYLSDNTGQNGDLTYARLGFRGETAISQNIKGFGQLESQYSGNIQEASDTSGYKTRLAFAGLKLNHWGSVDYGRNFGVNYQIGAWTDLAPDIVSDTSTLVDVYMTHRTDSVATYRNTDFFGLVDGLKFAVQYQGKSDDSKLRSLSKAHGDGVGGAISYEYNSISVGFSYAKSDRTNGQVSAGNANPDHYAQGSNAEFWNSAIKYDNSNVYLAAVYAETRNMTPYGTAGFISDKTQNFEAIVLYQLDNGLRPSLAYRVSKATNLNADWGDKYLAKYIDIATTYNLSLNMSVFIEYKLNLLEANYFTSATKINTDDVFATGIAYKF